MFFRYVLLSLLSISILSIINFILSGLKFPEAPAYIIFLLFMPLTAQIKKLNWVFPEPFLPAISIRNPDFVLSHSILSMFVIPVLIIKSIWARWIKIFYFNNISFLQYVIIRFRWLIREAFYCRQDFFTIE